MISFIVIGRNIERTIALCVESIFRFVKSNAIEQYEVIYVDSNSSDRSVQIAKEYPIRVFVVSGDVNAAIGRNVGAKNAKYDILFFIDGDMELSPEFYQYVINKDEQKLVYPFINGCLIHKFYDGSFTYLYTFEEPIPATTSFRNVTGGMMLIEKKLWNSVNGMDERLIRNQDLDLGFRLAKSGFPALWDNHVFAIHHTVNYSDKSRAIQFIFSKALFSPGLLMRKHLLYPAYLNRHKRDVLYVSMLIAALIFLFINKTVSATIIFLYLFIHAIRSLKKKKGGAKFLNSWLFKIFWDFYSLLGLLFYYPKKAGYNVIEVKKVGG
jgi:glycosyltransferase involved in cell wall biosynthesis